MESLKKLARRVRRNYKGAIRVKVASLFSGKRAIPEYEDCRDAASKHRAPLIEVIDRTTRLYYDHHRG